MINVCGTCKHYLPGKKGRCPIRHWYYIDEKEEACLMWEQKYDEVLMIFLRYKYGILRKFDRDYSRLPY